ncbi:1443_t:CDS:2 [Ambispora gerdemannii]|uniref:Transmembrane protein 198 n=1 Tax=Ambispora gerdemannii TaxID=144530 RepID=A0A9N8YNN2_9GLOM|nr:1443_t:CDS:2 [Ambispora gerdemannii]
MVFSTPVMKRDVGSDAIQQGQDHLRKITVHTAIYGIILISIGVLYTFFGIKFYRVTMFFVGFYIGSILAWVILTNVEPADGYGKSSDTIYLVITLIAGLLVGSLLVCCSDIAIWFLGALGGYALAIFLLSWANNGVIHTRVGRIVFIIGLTVAGVILTFLFENVILILSTALIGAYSIIFGIDMFANTGFREAVHEFLDGNHTIVYNTDTKVYLMLGGVLGFFIVGTAFQWRFHRGEFGKHRAAKSSKTSPVYSTPPENSEKKKKSGWSIRV